MSKFLIRRVCGRRTGSDFAWKRFGLCARSGCGSVVVEGVAEDGAIEAISIADAPGIAVGAQWHAEDKATRQPVNRVLMEAFGEAAKAWAQGAG